MLLRPVIRTMSCSLRSAATRLRLLGSASTCHQHNLTQQSHPNPKSYSEHASHGGLWGCRIFPLGIYPPYAQGRASHVSHCMARTGDWPNRA